MGNLSSSQADIVNLFLDEQGITFSPLREELLDHLISDLESRMDSGMSFPEAWELVQKEISGHHLKTIERETMKTINKKIDLTRLFSILSVILLAVATTFKILHLPGSGELLLGFLAVTSVLLVTSTVRNIINYPESRGRLFLSLITLSLIFFLLYLTFTILHLPGRSELQIISSSMLLILFPAISIYFYRSGGKLKDHVIIGLLSRNSSLMEAIALMMIGFGLVFNFSSWLTGETVLVGIVFFILTIIWIGLYAYSFTWSTYLRMPRGRIELPLLIFSTAALVLFILPLYGENLQPEIRNLAAFIAPIIYIGIIFYHYARVSVSSNRKWILTMCCLLVLYPILRLSAGMEWSPMAISMVNSLTFNISMLLFLLANLMIFRKETYFRILIIFMIAMQMIPNF